MHKLVKNPQRYIKGKKQHEPHLYINGAYTLHGNPFVEQLLDTRANTNVRFPIGNMVKLTVHEQTMIPVVNDNISLSRVYYTSSYIINSRWFVEAVRRDGSWRRYIPRKISQKNTDKPTSIADLGALVSAFYKKYVGEGLEKSKKEGITHSITHGISENGILLVSTGPRISFRGAVPVINISGLGFDIGEHFVRFEDHPVLCKLIIQMVDFEDIGT